MNIRGCLISVSFAVLAAWCTIAWATRQGESASGTDGSPQHARPPQWSRDVLDTFFEDARDVLVGSRPDYEHLGNVSAPAPGEPSSPGGDAVSQRKFAWSQLVDATTLETEVKRIHQSLANVITTPSAFKGGGYQLARREFSLLAVLFAVTGQYDGPVRWQDTAADLRDLFARAGYNAKVGTDATYNEAKLRQQDLADLIRGARPMVPRADVAVDWGQVADLTPLMQRLDIAHRERLTKWLADSANFRRHRDEVRHEAQLVALLAETISRDGFDYWDEEEYSTHAHNLKQSAQDIAAAARQDNFDAAREAVGQATKACAACHADYRG